MILESEFPPALKDALDHATSLSQALAEPALIARLDRWAIGRGDEISRFVELVVGDWRTGALSENAAAAELESYVRTLESALHERLTAPDLPSLPLHNAPERPRSGIRSA
jgi:hypothetical protein